MQVWHNLQLLNLGQNLHTNLAIVKRTLLIVFVVSSLSSCGKLPALNGEPSRNYSQERKVNQELGTHGQLISIKSDNVWAAGYDESSMVMTVQFDNGALYEYYGVSADLWTSFIAAQPHPWSQVGYPRLVKSGVPYRRIR